MDFEVLLFGFDLHISVSLFVTFLYSGNKFTLDVTQRAIIMPGLMLHFNWFKSSEF